MSLLTEQLLIVLLVALVVLITVFAFLIFWVRRKRSSASAAAAPAQEEQIRQAMQHGPETGPTDHESIKASIIGTSGIPDYPKDDELEVDESAIVEGVEPGETLLKPFPVEEKPKKERQQAQPTDEEMELPKSKKDKDLMVMGKYAEPVKKRKLVRLRKGGELDIQGQEGEAVAPEEAMPKVDEVPEPREEERPAVSKAKVSTAQIAEAPEEFHGKAVTIDGSIKLSSKGKNDAWYVLFDSSGSAVIRSRDEIPFDKVRVTAKVEKTKLGQTYLDVRKFEKLKA